MSKSKYALVSGISLVLMTFIAIWSLGITLSSFQNPIADFGLKENILSEINIYNNMLIGIYVILFLDILVSFTLYKYFEDVNKRTSMISALIRVVYTFIYAYAVYFLREILYIDNIDDSIISLNFVRFQSIWEAGLILFGFHVLLLASLMKQSNLIPKIIYIITYIAGFSYIIIHTSKSIFPTSEINEILEITLSLPMALGEFLLATWLIFKGSKDNNS